MQAQDSGARQRKSTVPCSAPWEKTGPLRTARPDCRHSPAPPKARCSRQAAPGSGPPAGAGCGDSTSSSAAPMRINPSAVFGATRLVSKRSVNTSRSSCQPRSNSKSARTTAPTRATIRATARSNRSPTDSAGSRANRSSTDPASRKQMPVSGFIGLGLGSSVRSSGMSASQPISTTIAIAITAQAASALACRIRRTIAQWTLASTAMATPQRGALRPSLACGHPPTLTLRGIPAGSIAGRPRDRRARRQCQSAGTLRRAGNDRLPVPL